MAKQELVISQFSSRGAGDGSSSGILNYVTLWQSQQFPCIFVSYSQDMQTQKQVESLEAERTGKKEESPHIRKEGKEKVGLQEFASKPVEMNMPLFAGLSGNKEKHKELFIIL